MSWPHGEPSGLRGRPRGSRCSEVFATNYAFLEPKDQQRLGLGEKCFLVFSPSFPFFLRDSSENFPGSCLWFFSWCWLGVLVRFFFFFF